MKKRTVRKKSVPVPRTQAREEAPAPEPLPSGPLPRRTQALALESMPVPAASETRLRAAVVGAGIERVAARFRVGDFHGALASAMQTLDEAPIPYLHATPTYLARANLSGAQRLIVPLVDGVTPLEEIIDATGLGLLEGLEEFADLLDGGIVGFDPEERSAPLTIPGLDSA